MPKTTINLRVEKKLKNDAENILNELGISMTTAVVIYLKAITRTKSIPFSIAASEDKNKKGTKSNPSRTIFQNELSQNNDLDFDNDESLKDAIDLL